MDYVIFCIECRCLHSFTLPNDSFTENARFNKKGNRLLCALSGPSPAIFDLPKFPDLEVEQEPTRLTGTGYHSKEGTEGLCFAGKDDELAVVASTNKEIFIWSVPEGQTKVDKPLLILRGHQGYVGSIRFSAKHSALASTDGFGVIKFWTTEIKQ
jgi:WD40 repeat protein